MDATEDFSVSFHTVTDHPAVTVRANWRQRVDSALEAIKRVALSGNDHLKRLVIVIFANFAFSHTSIVRAPSPSWRCWLCYCEAHY
jgi:hypothetical protein